MNNEPGALEGIADIEPLAMPMLYELESTASNVAIPGLMIIGLLLIITTIIWKRYFSPKGKSRYQLVKLQQQHAIKKITDHHAAHQISTILKNNLGLNPVLKRTPFPEILAAHKPRWNIFNERLSVACYSSSEVDPELTSSLFEDAYFWLKYWPNKNG